MQSRATNVAVLGWLQLALLASVVFGQPGPGEPLTWPATEVFNGNYDLSGVVDLDTGQDYSVFGLFESSCGLQVVFDSMSNPCGDPNGLPNVALADGQGSPVCPCDVDPNQPDQIGGIFPLAAGPCGDPNRAGWVTAFPALGITDPLDRYWDNYMVATEGGATGPNTLMSFERIDFTFVSLPGVFEAPPSIPASFDVRIATHEAFDVDADGQLEQLSAVAGRFFVGSSSSPGIYVAKLDLRAIDPNLALVGYGRGLLSFDISNRLEWAGADLGPACIFGNVAIGGIPGDAVCGSAQDFVSVGTIDSHGPDTWFFANASQRRQPEPPFDPNLLLGPGEDVLNHGLLFELDLGTAPSSPFRLWSRLSLRTSGCGAPCSLGGCTCADLDVDGDVDLTDLAIVLTTFGVPDGAGDTDQDRDVDLTDLAVALALFGNVCP